MLRGVGDQFISQLIVDKLKVRLWWLLCLLDEIDLIYMLARVLHQREKSDGCLEWLPVYVYGHVYIVHSEDLLPCCQPGPSAG